MFHKVRSIDVIRFKSINNHKFRTIFFCYSSLLRRIEANRVHLERKLHQIKAQSSFLFSNDIDDRKDIETQDMGTIEAGGYSVTELVKRQSNDHGIETISYLFVWVYFQQDWRGSDF